MRNYNMYLLSLNALSRWPLWTRRSHQTNWALQGKNVIWILSKTNVHATVVSRLPSDQEDLFLGALQSRGVQVSLCFPGKLRDRLSLLLGLCHLEMHLFMDRVLCIIQRWKDVRVWCRWLLQTLDFTCHVLHILFFFVSCFSFSLVRPCVQLTRPISSFPGPMSSGRVSWPTFIHVGVCSCLFLSNPHVLPEFSVLSCPVFRCT